jgi:hypothetical protein
MSEEAYKGAKTKIRQQNVFDIYTKGENQGSMQTSVYGAGFGNNNTSTSFFASRAF